MARLGVPSSSQIRLPGTKGCAGSSHREMRSSTTCSPSRPTRGDVPLRTVLPLNPLMSGPMRIPAKPRGVNRTGMERLGTVATRLARSSWSFMESARRAMSVMGWHDVSESDT